MGKRSRSKGSAGEREVVNILKDGGYSGVKRGLSQCRGGGVEVPDIEGFEIYGIGIHPEIKRGKCPVIHAAYVQAHSDASLAGEGLMPMAITRGDRRPWLVTLSLGDFLNLLTTVREAGGRDALSPPVVEDLNGAGDREEDVVIAVIATEG